MTLRLLLRGMCEGKILERLRKLLSVYREAAEKDAVLFRGLSN